MNILTYSMPLTDKQREYWNSNGYAVKVIGTLVILGSAVEVLFSGSNIANFVTQKLHVLPYADTIGMVVGYGLIAACAYGLFAFITVLTQNIYRNNDDITTNDVDSGPNKMYFAIIIAITAGMLFFGVQGAKFVGTEVFAYKAATKETTDHDRNRDKREADARDEYKSDAAKLEQTTAAQVRAAQAKHRANAQAWKAKAKGTAANVAWANKQAQAHEAQAESAAATLLAKGSTELKKLQDTRDRSLANTATEHNTQVAAVTAYNTAEGDKATASQTEWSNGMFYLSLFVVPFLIGCHYIKAMVLAKSGMYLESPFETTLHEGGWFDKMKLALSTWGGAFGHNIAAGIHNSAPQMKAFTPNTAYTPPNIADTADTSNSSPTLPPGMFEKILARLDNMEKMQVAAEKKTERIVVNPFNTNPDASTAHNPQMKVILPDQTPPIVLEVETPKSDDIQHIQPENAIYIANTAVGEGLIYSSDDVKDNDEVSANDTVIAETSLTEDILEIMNLYRQANKYYTTYRNRFTADGVTQTDTVKDHIRKALSEKAIYANKLYEKGLIVKLQAGKFVLVSI